jgi:K+-transporting ATPase KdpF subunit
MTANDAIGLVVAIVVAIYLIVALLAPERL